MTVPAGTAAFGGLLAVLAGTYGLRQARRVRRTGVRVEALVKRPPGYTSDEPALPRPLLQFVADDDRVIEVVCPVAPTRRRPLNDGDRVLILYDPADPRTVVVHDLERPGPDRAFITAGTLVMLLSVTLIAVAVTSR
ncbi:DUF3592 domain-containing protein [Streptomyces inhibens]|uniref:DUF3592 domain-containing protein n=1 Tax=Streptomyces inhibens TaxID=2293571 RepID=UPI001EE6FB70|nr:DUF3592 domain-containing protein [Streptomyces inhibens]UKY47757.1 hypothetical protein KI385_02180 [Streptomyces inhibens]